MRVFSRGVICRFISKREEKDYAVEEESGADASARGNLPLWRGTSKEFLSRVNQLVAIDIESTAECEKRQLLRELD